MRSKAMKDTQPNDGFHAGRYLQESLMRSGFSIKWLSEKTDIDEARLEHYFTQSHIDSELLVDIGRPMGRAFFDSLKVTMFGRKPIV